MRRSDSARVGAVAGLVSAGSEVVVVPVVVIGVMTVVPSRTSAVATVEVPGLAGGGLLSGVGVPSKTTSSDVEHEATRSAPTASSDAVASLGAELPAKPRIMVRL